MLFDVVLNLSKIYIVVWSNSLMMDVPIQKNIFLSSLLISSIIGCYGFFIFSIAYLAFMGEAAYNGTDFLYYGPLQYLFPFFPIIFLLFFGYCFITVTYLVFKNKKIIRRTKEIVFGSLLLLFFFYISYLLISNFLQSGTFVFFAISEASSFANFLLLLAPYALLLSSLLLSLFYLGKINIKK